MIFGLFKSPSQRSEELLRMHNNSLRGLDERGLGALALYCSTTRLGDLDEIKSCGSAEAYQVAFNAYYQPILLPIPIIEKYIEIFDRAGRKLEKQRLMFANNPVAQSQTGLLVAANQTWRNTWLGCCHSEIRYLSQEMWGMIRRGFPHVEYAAALIEQESDLSMQNRDFRYIGAAVENGDNGPDYKKIPQGFT